MNLTDPIFSDETKAREYFESLRWPNGPVCVHCGETEKVYRLSGKSHRPGLIHCNACDGSFTVTTGGVMESSHIPLTKWALGFRLMAASKKGVSAHQLMRTLGLGSYRTAWFMAHRIREAMAPANPERIGGEGVIVEADETEISPSRKTRKPRSRAANKKFVSLVERGGKVRSRVLHGAEGPIGNEVRKVLYAHMHPESVMHTDGAPHYMYVGASAGHEAVNHSKEFARTAEDGSRVYTNSAEGYFSIFKRGLVGTYQHMSEQHLPRYLNEFDFRMSYRVKLGFDDDARTEIAIKGAAGKRLTYHQPH
ncbi:MAG TPA: IS1595 family transposase [Rhizomicrobium sp.]|jgi:transposase-like protein|nr:IS1595 family transposase [Rhizomicrobium sp.]